MLVFVLVTLWVAAEAVYLPSTPYDKQWTRSCPLNTVLARMSSVCGNNNEDRTWSFSCNPVNELRTSAAQWSGQSTSN